MIRFQIIFTGHVQQVGFRFYSTTFANENNCTGWVKNQSNGSVLMEIQGEVQRIDNVVHSMKELEHITIETIRKREIPLQDENSFTIAF